MSMNDRFHQWIFNSFSVTPEGLGLLRIISSLFILFFLIPGQGTGHFAYLADIPSDFFAPPPGPLMLLDGFPSAAVFQFLHTLLLFALFAMLLGYRTRLASIVTGLTILLLQGFIFSVGKVNHEIVVALVPFLMAFSNWGAAFSLDSIRRGHDSRVESWPVTMLALFIGFMMFTAGFPKILGGWLDPSTQAAQGHLLNQFFVRERQAFLAGYMVQFDNVVFWELLDWATVIFEIGFLVAVINSRWFRYFAAFAVLFHFSTMMTLNIAFLPNFLAYAVFLNWEKIYLTNLKMYRRFTGKRGERSKKRSVITFSVLIALLFAIIHWLSSGNVVLADSDLTLHEAVILFFALFVMIWIGVMKLINRRLAE
jgi:hypothetical protein